MVANKLSDNCLSAESKGGQAVVILDDAQSKLKVTDRCRIALLDNTEMNVPIYGHTEYKDLFEKAVEHLKLLEKDYFGLSIRDREDTRIWLKTDQKVVKQLKSNPGQSFMVYFEVKFYPTDPLQLQEDMTKYLFCLQLRNDIVNGRLPCSFITQALLGSYLVQSQFGDFDPAECGPFPDYLTDFKFAPQQSVELLEKIHQLHKTHKGQTPAEAETHYLDNAKKLALYGVDLYSASDKDGVNIQIGVCASGVLVFRDHLRINRFAWPKILKISYRRNFFYIKIRPGEFEQAENTIGFRLANYRSAKRLWQACVEHHTFFRLVAPDAPQKESLLKRLGSSRFHFSGRTQYQSRLAFSLSDRQAPPFQRSLSGRVTTRSLDEMANHEKFRTPPEARLHTVSFIDDKSSRDLSPDSPKKVPKIANDLEKAGPKCHLLKLDKSPDDFPGCDYTLESGVVNKLDKECTKESLLHRQNNPKENLKKAEKKKDEKKSKGSSGICLGKKKNKKTDEDKKNDDSKDQTIPITSPKSAPEAEKKEKFKFGKSNKSSKNKDEKQKGKQESKPANGVKTAEAPIVMSVLVKQAEPDGPLENEADKKPGVSTTISKVETREEFYDKGPVQTVVVEGEDGIRTTTVTTQVRTVKQIIQRQTLESFSLQGNGGDANGPIVQASKHIFTPTSDLKISSTNEVPLVPTHKTQTHPAGAVETHTERRLIITSTDTNTHDSDLNAAILEATGLDPKIQVEKVELKHQD